MKICYRIFYEIWLSCGKIDFHIKVRIYCFFFNKKKKKENPFSKKTMLPNMFGRLHGLKILYIE